MHGPVLLSNLVNCPKPRNAQHDPKRCINDDITDCSPELVLGPGRHRLRDLSDLLAGEHQGEHDQGL